MKKRFLALLLTLCLVIGMGSLLGTTVTIPREFDKVFAAYNEMQRGQGLDLSTYSGKTVERYTYTVTNYENYEGTVLANLLIYRGRVIGGDICSADTAGFVHGFNHP